MKLTQKILITWLLLALAACQTTSPQQPSPVPNTPDTAATIPAASPAASPLPTLPPVIRINTGDQALFYGDYDKARSEYNSALSDSTDPALKAAALWGLSRTDIAAGQYPSAIATLIQLTNEYPDSTYAARGYFLLGQAYAATKQFQQSADAYNTYISRVPGVIDAYVQDYRGDALYQAADYTGAINAYESALSASRLDDGLNLRIKIGDARFDFGDFAGALAAYEEIFNTSTNDYVRAQMEYYVANTYLKLEQPDQAYARYLHTVENYPLSYYSYLSLVQLVDANIAVSDLDRGIIDYYAGQYDVALVALERFIKENPVNDGTPGYYLALTLQELGRNQEAVSAFDKFIEGYPAHPRWEEAWDEKAYVEWVLMGRVQDGIDTYIQFVAASPNSTAAPGYLMSAARITERDGKLEKAAEIWERVANEYPSNENVPDALFLAGIQKYRLSDLDGALLLFQRDLILSQSPEDRARAYFWIGKTQFALGDSTASEQSWQQAQQTDPYGYYSIRAQDFLLRRAPFESSPTLNFDVNYEQERKDAEAWMRITFNLPSDTDLSVPGSLASDPRFIRGTELWELGMYDLARLEFESLREAVQNSPVDSFRLANHMHEIGLYRPAIFAARQVLTLAGLESQSASLTAPSFFNHMRYGLYYQDLILDEEARYNLDRLFMFSVIRQESLFEGFVRSNAGARGLMQVIPPTGQQIAGELNWPQGYTEDDLYRPNVSVRFGSYYLDKNRRLLGGSIYGSLAAYNAGPGNALVWKELAGDDPDLFLEVVRFEETRNYIRYIYEIYNIYRMIYSKIN